MSLSRAFKTVFFWIFIIVLSISFIAYFGMSGETIGGGMQRSVGKVDGELVDSSRNSYFYDVLAELSSLDYPMTVQNQQILERQAFYEVAAQMVVEKKAEASNLEVEDEQLISYLKNEYFSGNVENWNEFVKMTDKKQQGAIQIKAKQRLMRKMYEQSVLYNLPPSHKSLVSYINIAKVAKEGIVARFDGNELLNEKITDEVLRNYFNENSSRYAELESASTNVSNSSVNFNNVRSAVYDDYIIENRTTLQTEITKEILQRLSLFVTTLNGTSQSNRQQKINSFYNEFSGDDVAILEMEPLSFYSRQVAFKGSQAASLQNSAVHAIMGTPVLSANYLQGNNFDFYAFLVTDEKKFERISDENLYLQYSPRLENNYMQRIRTSYYAKMFADIPLEFNGEAVAY